MQQSPLYDTTLVAMGIPARSDPQTGAQWITRGPLSVATRLGPDVDLSHLRDLYGRRFCIVSPDKASAKPLHDAGFRQIMTPATIAELDLTRPIAPHVKWRNAVKLAKKSPVKTKHRVFHPTTDYWILQTDLAQQKLNKYRGLPHGILHNWPKRDRRISLAYEGKTPVAAMVFLRHETTVTYQIGWTGLRGRKHNAHQLLLHEATRHFAAKGVTKIDLGTADSVNAPGLARFKARSGATFRMLGGTWIAQPRWRS